MRKSIFAIAICVLTLNNSFAQKEKKIKLSDDSLKISLERTCPLKEVENYKLKIYEGGFVYYDGIKHVANTGHFGTQLTKAEIDGILEKATNVKFYDLNDSYTESFMANDNAVLMIKVDKNYSKRVSRKGKQPAVMLTLENHITKLVKSKELVPVKLKH